MSSAPHNPNLLQQVTRNTTVRIASIVRDALSEPTDAESDSEYKATIPTLQTPACQDKWHDSAEAIIYAQAEDASSVSPVVGLSTAPRRQ